ncbi:MAG: nucleoside kinase [Lachnospiraceae bacterium]|nr:nucleoside kinase [Lachnospiraceae bacterium]
MKTEITVKIKGKEEVYQIGMTYGAIAALHQSSYDSPIALVLANGKIRELHRVLNRDCELSFITLKDQIGHKTYVRSAIMLLFTAIDHILGKEIAEKAKFAFTIGNGYYCHLHEDFKLTDDEILRINETMRDLASRDLAIEKIHFPIDDAMALFKSRKMSEKEKLFKYRRSSSVNIYCLDGYYDYYYGYMLPSCGYLKYFNVIRYDKGLMLILPDRKTPETIPDFVPREKLFKTLLMSEQWGEKMEISTVGDLNNAACEGKLNDMILVQEALQEHRIGEIAQAIAKRGGVKFVMIAGPSSSGKTTFSHRLSIQLRTYGLIPHPIGLDDYYLDRDKTPRDEDGNLNFETLDAIDVKQFNQDMADLLAGHVVDMPSFNFLTGKREYKGDRKRLGPDDILVVEGIHGLNPKTSHSLPDESKFKIYISCLTGLNVDSHNRIPTTDSRLLRRLVRDSRTRGADAARTIGMWTSVRRGEEEYIFPYQEDADEMFNSALIYELAVLKQYAEPLLFQISKEKEEYYEAKRLLKFLEYIIGVNSENVPNNSICREFIGGSIFHA